MGYYVRVLSTSDDCIPVSAIQSTLEKNEFQAIITMDESESNENWTQLILSHPDGRAIADIERNLIHEGSLGTEELAEFAQEVINCKPTSGAQWLVDYFTDVQCIYAFQVLSGTEYKNGWEILDAVKDSMWSFAPSIFQADSEGFSNEQGDHILWQFGNSTEGNCWMAVLLDGKWENFMMDLGNLTQRESFFKGQIPNDARLT
jgi:hypothetical protein